MTRFVRRYESKQRTEAANATRHAAIFQGKRNKVIFRDVFKSLTNIT
jgi:hypothetical protein